MNNRMRTQMFTLLAMALPLAACAQQPDAAATTPAAQHSTIATNRSATPAPQLEAGLPDFTNLVDQVGPGVVNVETVITRKDMMRRSGRAQVQMPDDDQIPEIFRRFFGPDFPMPGMQRGPRGSQRDDGDDIAGRGMGSGFILSADGYVLTNHHVVDDASKVTVKLSDGREFEAKVVGSDEQYDVALLKIEAKGLPIEAAYPEEGMTAWYDGPCIVAQAPHPEAAELFMDYLISDEARAIYRKYGFETN